jgi:hypothetical protein
MREGEKGTGRKTEEIWKRRKRWKKKGVRDRKKG